MLALNHRTKHTSVTVLTDLRSERVFMFFWGWLKPKVYLIINGYDDMIVNKKIMKL